MLKRIHKKTNSSPSFLHKIGILLFICFFAGVVGLSCFLIWAATIDLPDFSLFETRKVTQSTKIYDRTGKILLYDVHKDIRRTIVPFENISPFIKNATVAIEDDQFYQHFGIKPKAILRAILVNARSGEYAQGGSTITQQVVKNALLSKEKTISRKLKEWILAIRLERIMNKEQILGLYLNETPYGGNIYGVEEASRSYFGKSANDVTLAEAAYIAALPQAPTLYSPYGNNRNLLEARKNQVLKKMLALGSITQNDFDLAMKEEVKFLPPDEHGIIAPHFVMFVKEQLAKKYGEELLNEGGLTVTTTLDVTLQQAGEKIVATYAAKNEKEFNAHNAGLIAIDPKTGEILTMVGSRDYFDRDHDGNFNITLANRQPGSSFKPIVYGAAFERGYTPNTVLFDVPTEFSTRCDVLGNPTGSATQDDCYRPENYDHSYRGPMTLRDALSQSVNIPAVKLLYLVGVDNALNYAKRLGITTLLDKNQYGLTLVLGGGEVNLLEMTNAYAVYANDGKYTPYQGILKVTTTDGKVLEEYFPSSEQVIDPEIARNMNDVLSDNVARTPAFGAASALYIPERKVAVKTGTTNDYRDTWIIGYTPTIAVGAWAGNNDNKPMEKKVAGFIIAPLWNAFIEEAIKSVPDEQFQKPLPIPETTKPALRGIWYGNTTYIIDKYSGKLATDQTPPEARETRVIPDPHEILHWVDKDNPTGPAPTDPTQDPQYWHWETPARAWINLHGLPALATQNIPQGYDDIHTNTQAPVVHFSQPTASSTCVFNEKLVTIVDVTAPHGVRSVDLYFNSAFVGSMNTPPYIFAFIPGENNAIEGNNELRAVAHDLVDNSKEEKISLFCSQINNTTSTNL